MELKAFILFICVTTVLTVALRCRHNITRLLAGASAVFFAVMLYVGILNYPNEIRGNDLNIMGISAVLGLAFTLMTVIMHWILISKKKNVDW